MELPEEAAWQLTSQDADELPDDFLLGQAGEAATVSDADPVLPSEDVVAAAQVTLQQQPTVSHTCTIRNTHMYMVYRYICARQTITRCHTISYCHTVPHTISHTIYHYHYDYLSHTITLLRYHRHNDNVTAPCIDATISPVHFSSSLDAWPAQTRAICPRRSLARHVELFRSVEPDFYQRGPGFCCQAQYPLGKRRNYVHLRWRVEERESEGEWNWEKREREY